MSTFNLLDMAKSYFSNELVNKASAHLGESEGGISKAISAVLPSIIGGLSDKASSGTDGAGIVAKMAADQHDGGILDSIGSFLNPDTSNDMLGKSSSLISGLFGNGGQSNMLTTLISSFSGVKGSSVGTLMSMAAPMLLGLVGKFTKDTNLPISGLASMLGEQKKSAMSNLPAGFSLSSLTGGASNAASAVTGAVGNAASAATGAIGGAASSIGGAASSIGGAASGAVGDLGDKVGGGGIGKILLPLLLVGGLAAAAYYFFTRKTDDATPNTTITTGTDTTGANKGTTTGTDTARTGGTTATIEAPKATVGADGLVNYDLGPLGDLELPGGVKLTGVNANGFENTLVNFIKTGTIDTVNKSANWFNLHDVQFVSGKTTYSTPKAMAQIKNVGAILKAYPNVVIKVGGNTDVSGNAAANVALSQSRATQVMKDILANGAGATQIKEATGYGSQFATAAAGDKAGMAADRKTTAKVASK
jgi:OmpA-OmpF porin, OOP family